MNNNTFISGEKVLVNGAKATVVGSSMSDLGLPMVVVRLGDVAENELFHQDGDISVYPNELSRL